MVTRPKVATPKRLDKVLGAAGVGSRKEIRSMIKAGRVVVDGTVAQDPGMKVDCSKVHVFIDDEMIPIGPITMIVNKPRGYVTARKDAIHPTVFDLLPPPLADRTFPAGRLDKDSEGLLVVTDDGALCHRLISPRHGIEKEYLVTVDGPIATSLIHDFSRGIELKDGTTTRPATLNILKSEAPGQATLTIREGKYHQVRRMFAWAGLYVTRLERVRIGNLTLPDTLPPGRYRRLTQEEIALLEQERPPQSSRSTH